MKAVFMMGGPAAGKSSVRARLFPGMTVVDSDQIKQSHPDFDPKNPSVLHDWSSLEATRQMYAALGSGVDVVFDGTGKTADKYVGSINAAHAAGYETEVIYVTCSLSDALARNAAQDARRV